MSKLYYKKDAGWDWNFALPIGNGKLGAMIYGGPKFEHVMLNEDSIWYGGPQYRINQDAKANLEKVRELIMSGNIPEAEELILHSFSGTPCSQRPYSLLGEINLDYKSIKGEVSDYSRTLDLEDGVHIVKKTADDITYIEKSFASFPKNCLVFNVATKNGETFNLDINAARMCFYDRGFHDEKNVYFIGEMPGDNYKFACGLRAFSDDGEISIQGEYILARNVSNVTVVLTAATTYREENPVDYCKTVIDNASLHSFDFLLEEHLLDYHELFNKTRLHLEYDKELDELTTDERLKRFSAENSDNGLVETYFDYGRYLLISSSRSNSLPANLQGVWNKDLDPPWGCKYTININTQMNYWPAEMYGLGDCHLALFELLKKVWVNGKVTAKEMYGCRGFVCHHNTDLWGDTAPQDLWIPGTYWVMSIPWLCTHIMQHYKYTLDLDFLKEMYPLVKDSVLFFHDYLFEKDGSAIICPSVSPENTYILPDGTKGSICYGSSMDNEILRDHFTNFIKMYEIVGDDDEEFLETTKNWLSKIPPIKVGCHGQIMEWMEDYDEAEPGHRHISQLYALHPSDQITVDKTPDLAFAAANTISRRLSFGGGHTGWSRAWIMNMYARLWDREKVYDNLVALFKNSTLDNLFDNHPPFQIDGNFGSVAAIGEAILQANDNRVVLLPALPEQFANGSMKNIYVPGGASFSLNWENGKLKSFSAKANVNDYHTIVVYKSKKFKLDMVKGEQANFEIYDNEIEY